MHEATRARLRDARKAAGHSLRSLASMTGVSASQLSQIEKGKSEPSVSSLFALVSALNISLDELLDPAADAADVEASQRSAGARKEEQTAPPALSPRENTPGPARSGTNGRHHPVIAPLERPVLEMESGVRWERLTRDQIPGTDTLLVTYHPGGKSSSDGKSMVHSGTEVAYIISGQLILQLGFETYTLKAGDSMAFESSTPHLFFNPGDVPAVGVWLVLREGLQGGSHLTQSPHNAGALPIPADFAELQTQLKTNTDNALAGPGE